MIQGPGGVHDFTPAAGLLAPLVVDGNDLAVVATAEVLVHGVVDVLRQEVDGAVPEEEIAPARVVRLEAKRQVYVLRGPGVVCTVAGVYVIRAVVDRRQGRPVGGAALDDRPVADRAVRGPARGA